MALKSISENNTNKNEVFLDYTRFNGNIAFNKINAGRMPTFLILSETISPNVLPFDPFEALLLFKSHFKGSKTEAFTRYFEYHEQDPDKIMDYYRSISKTNILQYHCKLDKN